MGWIYRDSNGNEIPFYGGQTIQVDALPTASASIAGTIYQYTGETTASYTHGYIYECIEDPENTGGYIWSAIDVQDAGSAGGIAVSLYRYGDLIKKDFVESGTTITLPRVDSYNNYEFVGWSATKDATTAPDYAAGDTITVTADVSLYAVFGKVTESHYVLYSTTEYNLRGDQSQTKYITQEVSVGKYDKVEFSGVRYVYSSGHLFTNDITPYDYTTPNAQNISVYETSNNPIIPAIMYNTNNETVNIKAYYEVRSNYERYYKAIMRTYNRVVTYSEYTQHYDTRDIPRYEQTEYINGVKIVEFGKGSYDELQAMVAAHKAGLINIYDYWKVGDTRQIHIDAISAYVDNDVTIYDAMPEQDVYATLWSTSLMSDTNVLFIVAIGAGMYNTFSVHHDSTVLTNGFADSDLQYYLSSYLYPAMESGFKSLLSSFSIKTYVSASLTYEGTVYMTLPSRKEFGIVDVNGTINNAFDFFSAAPTSSSLKGDFAAWERTINNSPSYTYLARPARVWTRENNGTNFYIIAGDVTSRGQSNSGQTVVGTIIPIVAIK